MPSMGATLYNWSAFQYVTSGLSLLAFVATALLVAYRSKLKAKAAAIGQALPEDRLRAIGAAAEWLGVDLRDVPEGRRADLILAQINQRSRRDVILAILSFGIALVIGFVAVSSPSLTRRSTALQANTPGNALLLGYDAAVGLARALKGADATQDKAMIDERLARLRIDLRFPSDPLGTDRDAAPSAEFAQQVSGILQARNKQLARAFQVGWLGVISLRGGTTPEGFSIRQFASEAGFNLEGAPASDEELLEWLVTRIRETGV